MNRYQSTAAWLLVCLISLGGCASWETIPATSQPYFVVETADAKSIHLLAKKQEGLAAHCTEHNSCEQAYFTRALMGLYESRDTASRYFHKVIATAPKGQLAVSSKLWLQLLQHESPASERSWWTSVTEAPAISGNQVTLGKMSDRLVRDLLDREVTIQQLRALKDAEGQALESLQRELAERERKMDFLGGKKDQAKTPSDPLTIQSLQKQLSDRDKKIDELSSQLEALKRIDQEMREKVRPIRPPSTVIPPLTPEPAAPANP
ncbi:MAG: hypothetical protein OEZ09_17510 [Betaproteobacteria bacterium]|nr:hypothetical protein [Betaproteobacteria bacterium]